MVREHGETERRATVLQDRLSAFANLDVAAQRQELKGMVAFIKATTTGEAIKQLVDREIQNKLAGAVTEVIKTPFNFPINSERRIILYNPWVSYTAVMIGSHGNVVGAVEQPCADGEDRHKFALTKALCALHLDKADRLGGLGNPDNLEYFDYFNVKSLEDVFMGSSEAPIQLGENKFYIGAGGCELNADYRRILLGLDLEDHEAESAYYNSGGLINRVFRNTQAGEVDNAFCDELVVRLTSSGSGLELLRILAQEPKRLRAIRLRN